MRIANEARAIRLLLVDADPSSLLRLRAALRRVDRVDVVGIALSGADALDEARRLRPDVVIVDAAVVDLDAPSSRELRLAAGAQLIVVAGCRRHALAAFEMEAVDYLLKPVPGHRLEESIERARRRAAEMSALEALGARADGFGETTVCIPDRSGCVDLPVSRILWIEAARDYALFHTDGRTHIKRISMRELERSLPETVMRVHRSAFVSLSEVRRLGRSARDGSRLVLSDGTPVPVGPSYLPAVRTALRSLRSGLARTSE